MSIFKTSKKPKQAVADDVIAICDGAKQLEDSGEYLEATRVMGNWWHGVGIRPAVDKLPDNEKATILSRIGALSGWLGSTKQIAGSQEKAKDLISESADLFEALGDHQNWAEARSDLAVCYWREGSFDEAKIILQHVLNRGFEFPPELAGKLFLRSVNVEISMKKYDRAMDIINKATSIVRHGSNLLRGKFYFHRGLIQRCEGENKNKPDLIRAAIADYQQAGVYYKKARHYIYLAAVENNLGNIYRLLNDAKKASTHFDRAIYLYVKVKDQIHAAQVYDCKAQTLLAEKQLDKAELAARQSVAMICKGGEQSLLSESLTTLGIALTRGGALKEAIRTFVEAKETALSVGDKESAGNAMLTYIEEFQSDLSPIVFRSLYLEADELVKNSPKTSTIGRLQKIARKYFELSDCDTSPEGEKITGWINFSLPEAVRLYERGLILKALNESGGRVTKAARLLGLSHQNLSGILHQRHKDLHKHCVQRKSRAA